MTVNFSPQCSLGGSGGGDRTLPVKGTGPFTSTKRILTEHSSRLFKFFSRPQGIKTSVRKTHCGFPLTWKAGRRMEEVWNVGAANANPTTSTGIQAVP